MTTGLIDYIDTPAQGNRPVAGATWCADNGCFSDKWEEAKWWTWLSHQPFERIRSCAFAVAPDVVGDADESLRRSVPWLHKIRELGYPVALVAQDGLRHANGSLFGLRSDSPVIRWYQFDILFIGGTDAWKLGPDARLVVAEAKRRGKRVHMGRVNSLKRLRYAEAIGCDSVDGTFLTFGPNVNLVRLRSWLRELHAQPPLA